MALQPQHEAKHNAMLGQRMANAEAFDSYEDEVENSRPLKRAKTGHSSHYERVEKTEIPDSDAESYTEDLVAVSASKSGLVGALPDIRTDQEAIDEYEAQKAAEQAHLEDTGGSFKEEKWVRGKSSIYVDAFNLALKTVLEEESHLFDDAEKAVFGYWNSLAYEAQYLYVRLFLRKTSAWHRINELGYHSDIANLDSAIGQLQRSRELPAPTEVQSNPVELAPPEDTMLGKSFTFADRSENEITTLEEASSLLRLDELKVFAKDVKVQGKNKKDLLHNFRRASRQQTGLNTISLGRSDTESSAQSLARSDEENESDAAGREAGTKQPEGRRTSRDSHFLGKIMYTTGPCIRLSLPTLKLFERVHLVFYRSTEWTEKSLTTIILAKIARRNFPEYIVSRSASIFALRPLLLEFEASLRAQFKIDNILEFHGPPSRDDLQKILQMHEEVYPRWRALLEEEHRKETHIYHSGEGAYLRRLSPAWVYTRIAHKAAFVLGKLKQHKEEHALLTELLDQRLFHHARRGGWYDRKALLEEHYMHALTPANGRNPEAQKKHWKRIALNTCEQALEDPLTHLVYHHDIQKRIKKLEKALNIPRRSQHDFSHVRLTAPVEVTIHGTRIEREADTASSISKPDRGTLRGSKTVWLDPLEGNGECSVEAMCLSHYRSNGWKGYHSEGGIVRTLFAYLFYDVLFTYVPNVFQTPFQTCPLDLHTDAFYPTRASEINVRLAEISNGGAKELIRKVWNEHSERGTCVVGLDWSYELEDLVEIAELFPADALATVCKVMAQEYGERGGGVPDLFLWHTGEKKIKFAEVKSENDRLSDSQRLWIHVLTGAGVTVELANAVAMALKVV